MSLYLADTSLLITANDSYYPIDRIPQYWDWLAEQARAGLLKIPQEIMNEITPSHDGFRRWLKNNKANLLLDKSVGYHSALPMILKHYGDDLTEVEVMKVGKDPLYLPGRWC